MTTVQLRAELFREMNPLLDNETALQKILTFVKSLVPAKKNKAITEEKSYETIPVSPMLKWLRIHSSTASEWNCQEAWNRLTDKQREEAMRLNLTVEDMDERTFAFFEKHLR